MSPLQAAAVENRLTAVRKKVVHILCGNRKPARYATTIARRQHAVRQLQRVLVAIDLELKSVKEPA